LRIAPTTTSATTHISAPNTAWFLGLEGRRGASAASVASVASLPSPDLVIVCQTTTTCPRSTTSPRAMNTHASKHEASTDSNESSSLPPSPRHPADPRLPKRCGTTGMASPPGSQRTTPPAVADRIAAAPYARPEAGGTRRQTSVPTGERRAASKSGVAQLSVALRHAPRSTIPFAVGHALRTVDRAPSDQPVTFRASRRGPRRALAATGRSSPTSR
jgi:hypothetical protein